MGQSGPKSDLKLDFLSLSQVWFISFPGIARDCNLGQCLTSSRAETSGTKFCGPNWGQNDSFYSNVVKRPLKLAFFIRQTC